MPKVIKEDLKNGITITRRIYTNYISLKINDSEGKSLKISYNHKTKKNIGANFDLTPYDKFGKVLHLSEKEAKKRHAGSTRYLLKLTEKKSEKDVKQQILIPAGLKAGLKENIKSERDFLIQSGENPFEWENGPFIKGYSFYTFTNRSEEVWAAYINQTTGDIWISCDDHKIAWEWKKIQKNLKEYPWIMNPLESEWFELMIKMSKVLSSLAEDFSHVSHVVGL